MYLHVFQLTAATRQSSIQSSVPVHRLHCTDCLQWATRASLGSALGALGDPLDNLPLYVLYCIGATSLLHWLLC
jgi:hypothetical protein